MATINSIPGNLMKNQNKIANQISDKGRQFIMEWEGLARWGTSGDKPQIAKLFPYDTAEKKDIHGNFPPYSKESFLNYHNNRKDWTIGYGHKTFNEKHKFQDGITKQEAINWFNNDIVRFENWIKQNILILPKVKEKPLNQNQFDALASYIFNIGYIQYSTLKINKGKNVTTKLYNALAAGDYNKACDEMNVTTSGGVFNQGLANRREAERKIWKNGIYLGYAGYPKHKHSHNIHKHK